MGEEKPDADRPADELDAAIDEAAGDPDEDPADTLGDPGAVLFDEPGGSKMAIWIGPVMIAAVLVLEIVGRGRIHWEVLTIFGVLLVGFGMLQYVAARRHVSVLLTENTLRQGAETVALADILEVYPENRTQDYQKWESARALGELHAVPRRRKGVGVRLTDDKLAQAWARDVDRFRTELNEAVLAVKLGLTSRGDSGS
ncbi:MAG: DUF3093 domain-containing protein [Gordonia sp. (in: high G+C Gram-positive bacteria)]|uniref:DUF3093 domain-containing protein n=1 Tax=Gordonia sp. (in: high G+C Gram-positive bacteria) TaxID=84139 RepID=UPI003BB4AF17